MGGVLVDSALRVPPVPRPPSRRTRAVRRFAGIVSVLVIASLVVAGPASAFIFVVPAPSYPDTVTVGQTFPAAIGITNASTPPEATILPVLRVSQVNHIPACPSATPVANCNIASPEAGVFALSPTGVGTDGPTCTGTWTITEISPGVFRFTPPGGEASLLLATGETCVVSFTATTLRVPTTDVNPAAPGVQTLQLATVVPSSLDNTQVFPANSGADFTTVLPATPGLATTATQSEPVGGAVTDTATLSGGNNPTGTITFTLFGADDPTCAGTPVFTSTVPVNGNGDYDSRPFTPTAPGTYQWVAVYSGDANNLPATSPCGAANEQSVVTVLPTIMVEKTANPTSLPAPGGDFAFTVVVTNTSTQNLTIASLVDDVYGDLNGRGSCRAGQVLPPGATYTCSFTADFRGNAGDEQTDTVTVTGVNHRNERVRASASARVALTPGPHPAPPPPPKQGPPLVRTGVDSGGPARAALVFVMLGMFLLVAATRTSSRRAVAGGGGAPGGDFGAAGAPPEAEVVRDTVGKASRRGARRPFRDRDRLT
jgi:Bacterial Ig-like domain (group 3)